MPGRKYQATNSSKTRFGFNGKENDNEVKGEGNQQDYGERIYDTRLGRFLSVDPLDDSYPYYTPYQFASNSPIELIDIDGAEGGKKIIEAISAFFDAIGDIFSTKSDVAEVEEGTENITEGVNKQVIGPWNANKIFNSENPGLTIELNRIDGQIQSYTGAVQVSSGIQGISNKAQLVVEIPMVIMSLSKPALKTVTNEVTTKNVRPTTKPGPPKIHQSLEETPPWNGPVDYSTLPEPRKVGPAKPFTRTQHKRIMEHNKKINGGVLRDDETGEILNPAKQDKRGVPSDMNSAQLDHYIPRKPKDKTRTPGTNSNTNAKVRSKKGNIAKSNS